MDYSVYFKDIATDDTHSLLETNVPEEAEAHYLLLCIAHRKRSGAVCLDSSRPEKVRPGYFVTGESEQFPREGDVKRFLQVWAHPPDGFLGPTTSQIRAAAKSSVLAEQEFVKEVGLSPEEWEKYTTITDEKQISIPWRTWANVLKTLRHQIDLEPLGEANGD